MRLAPTVGGNRTRRHVSVAPESNVAATDITSGLRLTLVVRSRRLNAAGADGAV
jgi:hypothetical protein